MSRIARRIWMSKVAGRAQRGAAAGSDPSYLSLDLGLRGRTGRKARAHLRRMEPVVVRTPRWSRPDLFLEDLALELALGEPAIGCRTVDFKHLRGADDQQCWTFIQAVFSQLGRRARAEGPLLSVSDRRGFRASLRQQLDALHDGSNHRVALLAHGAEHLPVEVTEDLAYALDTYCDDHPEGRRCALLLAAAVGSDQVHIAGAPRLDLVDYGFDEAALALSSRLGVEKGPMLAEAARFSGGVPGLLDAVGAVAQLGELDHNPDVLLGRMGRVGLEVRGAVDIAASDDVLADRLYQLLEDGPSIERPGVDKRLMVAGLVRRTWRGGMSTVGLRAPAIGTLLS